MRLPDFYIIGAMKAGTTTLDGCLRRHPGVFMCPEKEPQFFSRDGTYAKGMEWYASLFEAARADQLVGESSTCYSRSPIYPEAPRRILEHTPDARFVYVLRHPVARFHSHYGHRVREMVLRESGPVPSLREFLENDEEAFVAGLYAEQIERYSSLFPRERLHVLLFDDLRADPRGQLEELQRFLGLDVRDLTDGGALPRFNKRSETARHGSAKNILFRTRENRLLVPLRAVVPGGVRRLGSDLFLRAVRRSPITASRTRKIERLIEPLSDEHRSSLVERYRQSVDRLEEMLGRELSDWKR